ncbi:MAG: hypothetical protein KAX55_18755, partial [Propionivibrio sp.]|nr:hypothetical protein [Propionivibrio sp.]
VDATQRCLERLLQRDTDFPDLNLTDFHVISLSALPDAGLVIGLGRRFGGAGYPLRPDRYL